MTEPMSPEQKKSHMQLAREGDTFQGTPAGGRSFAVEGNDTSGYLGVDPEYRTYAHHTERPGVTSTEAEMLYVDSVSVNPDSVEPGEEPEYTKSESLEEQKKREADEADNADDGPKSDDDENPDNSNENPDDGKSEKNILTPKL